MPGDRTVTRPSAPKFSINEIVYLRSAAVRGYIEPLGVSSVRYDPSGCYIYEFNREFGKSILGSTTGNNFRSFKKNVIRIELAEDQVLTLCEALDFQISYLESELEKLEEKRDSYCDEEADKPQKQTPVRHRGLVRPPAPRFGRNDVVYLNESAETTGCLEAYRICAMRWNGTLNEWFYEFEISKRPEKNMVVGDRNEIIRTKNIYKCESELCTFCEVIPLAISFMERSISRARSRRTTHCGDSTE